MPNHIENLDELKRKIYLFAAPLLVLTIFLNNLLDYYEATSYYLGITLLFYFSFSWIMIYKRWYFRFIEISNLFLVSLYQLNQYYQSVQINLVEGNYTLGDFTMWMPLYVIYIYLTLGRKKGVLFACFVLALTASIGIQFVPYYEANSIDSIIQYHVANTVYIFAFYCAQIAFGVFSELKTIKSTAYIDPLTEVQNRRKLDLNLDLYWEKANTSKQELSIILIDLDSFKKINDQFGHDIGDHVLREFSQVISKTLRNDEIFGRWGGEEFMVLSPASLLNASKLAEHLRYCIEQHQFHDIPILTASFGVSHYIPGDTKETLIKRADIALYEAKSEGKNRVRVC